MPQNNKLLLPTALVMITNPLINRLITLAAELDDQRRTDPHYLNADGHALQGLREAERAMLTAAYVSRDIFVNSFIIEHIHETLKAAYKQAIDHGLIDTDTLKSFFIESIPAMAAYDIDRLHLPDEMLKDLKRQWEAYPEMRRGIEARVKADQSLYMTFADDDDAPRMLEELLVSRMRSLLKQSFRPDDYSFIYTDEPASLFQLGEGSFIHTLANLAQQLDQWRQERPIFTRNDSQSLRLINEAETRGMIELYLVGSPEKGGLSEHVLNRLLTTYQMGLDMGLIDTDALEDAFRQSVKRNIVDFILHGESMEKQIENKNYMGMLVALFFDEVDAALAMQPPHPQR